MKAKFHKPGTHNLTPYEFACGYIQTTNSPNGEKTLTLWHEGACYHVRVHDHANHKRIMWESFRLLSQARKEYQCQVRAFINEH